MSGFTFAGGIPLDHQVWHARNAHFFIFFRLNFQFHSSGLIGNSFWIIIQHSFLPKDDLPFGNIPRCLGGLGRAPNLHSIMDALIIVKPGGLPWIRDRDALLHLRPVEPKAQVPCRHHELSPPTSQCLFLGDIPTILSNHSCHPPSGSDLFLNLAFSEM